MASGLKASKEPVIVMVYVHASGKHILYLIGIVLIVDNAPSQQSEDALNKVNYRFKTMFLPPNLFALI